MGKRSQFDRLPRDFYPTPEAAVLPLLPHLPPATRFDEPCCGDGALIQHLTKRGHICAEAADIKPSFSGAVRYNALETERCAGDMFITNPPWSRDILHPMISRLSSIAPTWLLFDADWMHTQQSRAFMPFCRAIVSVGRVKWIPESTMTGKDNAAWYLFDRAQPCQTAFFGR